ncbi:S1C family serine protease [Arthrobacter roseus]|uniref:S1C family serine protease n=1 Tax=Arthrobacter roseus TaxID=136274 RepID=UPI001965DA52|nr:trypsin-like peptidase domain-containing protein [Arthrobacter roseus]MBM7849143.1 putative serine protease PepD [Arthrobacter roseus]
MTENDGDTGWNSGSTDEGAARQSESARSQVPPRPQLPPSSVGGPGYDYLTTGANNAESDPFGPQASTAQPVEGLQRNAVPGRARFGAGTLVVGMIVAGLAGGGVAIGYDLSTDGQQDVPVTRGGQESVVINDPNNVTPVTAAAKKAAPSVVTISAMGQSSGGSGSGIILDQEGHILTNNHVATVGGQVNDAKIEVRLSDGSVYSAKLIGLDPLSDLAVLKIDAPDLVPAAIGNSDELNVGDTAVAIGAPLGLSGTVTDGIVSTVDRTISVASSAVPKEQSDTTEGEGDGGDWRFAPPEGSKEQQPAEQGTILLNVIQTDAAINHGNSGGALVNSEGEVIGVNVAIAGADENSGNIGVGFSIPINYAHRVAEELISTGEATHGRLGVTVRPHPAQGAGAQTTFSVGAQVGEVTPDSPAAKAGLKSGDVVTTFDGESIEDARELTAVVREQAADSTVSLTFTRDDKAETVDITVGSLGKG